MRFLKKTTDILTSIALGIPIFISLTIFLTLGMIIEKITGELIFPEDDLYD